MEEFLLHHCVTADAAGSTPSSWQTSGRSECVLVQENREAHGASRVVLSAVLELTLRSAKTSDVLLLTLDSPRVAEAVTTSSKLTHVDYSADACNFQASTGSSDLLDKMLQEIERVETRANAVATRPVVLVLDSLNALLQQTSLSQVLLFLRQLRTREAVGAVIARLNVGAERAEVAQALAAQATAVVLVETRSSLRAYPLLSKERRREIPQGMQGLVQLVRQKKNGRSSESIEYFHTQGDSVQFIAVDSHVDAAITQETKPAEAAASRQPEVQKSSKPVAALAGLPLGESDQALLPVRQEDVSFNLSISAEEQKAKDQVQLPYMHHGQQENAANPLFFIDEDDPDWDDDDVDDDLDI